MILREGKQAYLNHVLQSHSQCNKYPLSFNPVHTFLGVSSTEYNGLTFE